MKIRPLRKRRLLRVLLIAAAAVATAAPALAAEEAEDFDAIGHTMDGTYLDFSPFGRVELPRIFLVRKADGALGLEAFASTRAALLSGRYVAVVDEAEHAGAGEPTEHRLTVTQEVLDEDAQGVRGRQEVLGEEELAGIDYLHGGIVRAEGSVVLDFSVTRHLVFAVLAALALLLVFVPMAGRYKRGIGRTEAPRGKLQNMLETVVIYIRDEVARPNLGPKTDRFLPYILTVFFFILFCNLFGLIPFGATATANISVTATLAIFTFVVTQLAGTKDYWRHVFNPPGIPGFIKPILVPIEIVGMFIKPFSLAIRLFANMTAGHLIILNLIGLVFAMNALFGSAAGWGTAGPSMFLALFIYGLELLVAFIQAYVFTILSALFIGMAAAEQEHHGVEHPEPGPHERAVAASAPLLHDNGEPLEQQTVGTEAALSPA